MKWDKNTTAESGGMRVAMDVVMNSSAPNRIQPPPHTHRLKVFCVSVCKTTDREREKKKNERRNKRNERVSQ